MINRSLHMIFEPSGQPVPTEEDVLYEAQEIVQRSGWGQPLIERLKKIADPYWREAITRNLLETWRELVRDKDEQTYYFNMDGYRCYCWADAEYDFGRIIRRCASEQVETEMDVNKTQCADKKINVQTEKKQLFQQVTEIKNMLETMAKQDPQHQTTIYNYGTYNDIHDNPNATIYTASQDTVNPDLRPKEGDYAALVKWLEIEKHNGNDHLADADYNRSKMCRNLLTIIGWEPNQDSLRKAQSR